MSITETSADVRSVSDSLSSSSQAANHPDGTFVHHPVINGDSSSSTVVIDTEVIGVVGGGQHPTDDPFMSSHHHHYRHLENHGASSPSGMFRYSTHVTRPADSTVIEYGVTQGDHMESLPSLYPSSHSSLMGDVGHHDRKPTPVLRPHSTPATLVWLEENYEIAEGVCIPRSALYMHYVDFCGRNHIQPVNAASFGKIIRQQFPQLTTRRLGTRGQSRYHYYGIAVRETSPYFQLQYSRKSGSSSSSENSSGSRRDDMNGSHPLKVPTSDLPNCQVQQNASNFRPRTVLPDFPSVRDDDLPITDDAATINTFIMMYRTHSQRILDTIVRANFDDIHPLLTHFWSGIPAHLHPLFSSRPFVNVVCACDCILYKTISSVIFPSILHVAAPENLVKLLTRFSEFFESWVRRCLIHLPEQLKLAKANIAHKFSTSIKRQLSVSRLASASRMVLTNSDLIVQMIHDWKSLDVESIISEVLTSMMANDFDGNYKNEVTFHVMKGGCEEFVKLMEREAGLESYLEWLDSLAHRCVVYPSIRGSKRNARSRLSKHSKSFILLWSSFESRVMRELTIRSATSFGSFHLLRLLFDEYILYLIEYVHMDSLISELLGKISSDQVLDIDPFDSFFPDACLTGSTTNDEEDMTSVNVDDTMSSQSLHTRNISSQCADCLPSVSGGEYYLSSEVPASSHYSYENSSHPEPYSRNPFPTCDSQRHWFYGTFNEAYTNPCEVAKRGEAPTSSTHYLEDHPYPTSTFVPDSRIDECYPSTYT